MLNVTWPPLQIQPYTYANNELRPYFAHEHILYRQHPPIH